MEEAEVVIEYTDYDKEEGTVESVTVVKTDDDEYPSGWKYRLHYGTIDGETLVRYDNSHEKQKGHEKHTGEEVREIKFSTMENLLQRFHQDVENLK